MLRLGVAVLTDLPAGVSTRATCARLAPVLIAASEGSFKLAGSPGDPLRVTVIVTGLLGHPGEARLAEMKEGPLRRARLLGAGRAGPGQFAPQEVSPSARNARA